MTNPPKATGTRFETEVVNYLNETPFNAVRTGSAAVGEGDIHFGSMSDDGEWTIEAKAEQKIDLPGYLKQLEGELTRRGAIPFKAAAVVKNRRHNVGDAYAVMRLERFRQLAAYVRALEDLLNFAGREHLADPALLRKLLGVIADEQESLRSVFGEFRQPETVALDEPLADWERELLEAGTLTIGEAPDIHEGCFVGCGCD